MNGSKWKLWIVNSDPRSWEMFTILAKSVGIESRDIHCFETGLAVAKEIDEEHGTCDILILDLHLPQHPHCDPSLALLRKIRQCRPQTFIIGICDEPGNYERSFQAREQGADVIVASDQPGDFWQQLMLQSLRQGKASCDFRRQKATA